MLLHQHRAQEGCPLDFPTVLKTVDTATWLVGYNPH
nr:MAG TPA_asm: hypothetical protein [Caudoviricetes sp.]